MAAPLRRWRELLPRRSDWTQVRPSKDLTAGLMVGLVALPLALGFGQSAGLGPGAGLVTAIVAGAVAAIFGGSRVQVSGPTGAMTVVLVPIVASHGADGVLVVGFLAGVLLIGLSWLGAGRYVRYVPMPVVEGFTAGIAVIIGLQQLPTALAVDVHAEKVVVLAGRSISAWVESPQWPPAVLAALTALLVVLIARRWPLLPGSLFVVLVATVVNGAADLGVPTIGADRIPHGLPAPSAPAVPWSQLDSLLLPAVAVAALAALESLLSATVADGMSVGRRHDPDRELFGQGLANLAAPVFGGVPATAAIARTAVNVRSGATSRLASLSHAVVLLVVVLVAAPLVGRIPLAALAGVLIATAWQMVHVSSIRPLLRATRGDAATLVATFVATVVLDLVAAVLIGLVVAGFFALREAARAARLDAVPLDDGEHVAEEQALLDEHIVAYRIDGPLFFAAAHDFLLELAEVSTVRVVILRLARVTVLDATGASVLADTVARLEARGVTVLLSGVSAAHEHVLRSVHAHERLAHERHLFRTTPDAIAHARLHVARIVHEPTEVAEHRR